MARETGWNMTSVRRAQVLGALRRDKGERDAFVEATIRRGVAAQIRFTRLSRGLTQRQLAELSDKHQATVSQVESLNYGKLTLSTLLKIAHALDVGLLVTLAPFNQLASWWAGEPVDISADYLEIPTFEEDQAAALEDTDTGEAAEAPNDVIQRDWTDARVVADARADFQLVAPPTDIVDFAQHPIVLERYGAFATETPSHVSKEAAYV
jgi:transcriptional regulator with XRE-family HTH domain